MYTKEKRRVHSTVMSSKSRITSHVHNPTERGIFGANSSTDQRIINDHDVLLRKIDACRELGQSIVMTSGSFDLAHIGHARYLEVAKSHGDILVVGVDSDAKVRKRKGDTRPVVPEGERQELLAHLKSVDLVTIKHPDEPRWGLIKRIRPDTLIVTEETYDTDTLEQLAELCGRVVRLSPQARTSTSAKIRHLEITWGANIKEPVETLLRDGGVNEALIVKVSRYLTRDYEPEK